MNKLSISHKNSTKLLITPQLKQALALLELSFIKLKEFTELQIDENPLLHTPSEDSLKNKINKILSFGANVSAHYRDHSNIDGAEHLSERATQTSQEISLQEHLLHQLRMTLLSDTELSIAQELINHIDDNGYLRIKLDEFAQKHCFPLDKTLQALKTIQELEPSGVGARNVQECLLIQLKNKDRASSLAYTIIEKNFKEFQKKEFIRITKKLDISITDVKTAAKEIFALNPRPGTVFTKKEQPITVEPDAFIRSHKNKFVITLKDAELPTLKINPAYKKILNDPDAPEETKRFIHDCLKKALWLIRAIRTRQENTLKVLKIIAQSQRKALLKNLAYIEPLTLKDIAIQANLHISTISRIISSKYVATPQGTIKLKDLLSPKLTSTKSGAIATKSILFKIKDIILYENKKKPLTDQEITNILRKDGLSISRRTIAKYRDRLKIPPSFLR